MPSGNWCQNGSIPDSPLPPSTPTLTCSPRSTFWTKRSRRANDPGCQLNRMPRPTLISPRHAQVRATILGLVRVGLRALLADVAYALCGGRGDMVIVWVGGRQRRAAAVVVVAEKEDERECHCDGDKDGHAALGDLHEGAGTESRMRKRKRRRGDCASIQSCHTEFDPRNARLVGGGIRKIPGIARH